ncbi:hypothetical protein F4680DRAFT_437987 [Xylaria scruposa]|nr:hypothetical protein F4680DRAFT_437987 [Xylaria scruposa]
MIEPSPQDDVDIPADTQPQGDTDNQKQAESQTEVTGLDLTSDAPVKPDAPVSAEDSTTAEAMVPAVDPIPVTAEDEPSPVVKESKKEKKKRKAKSQGQQEPTSDSLDKGIHAEESQESAILPEADDAGQSGSIKAEEHVAEQTAEQPADENVAPDNTLLEATTKRNEKGIKDLEVETTVSSDATPSSTADNETQPVRRPTSRFLPSFSFSSFRHIGRTQGNEADAPQSAPEDKSPGTSKVSSILKLLADKQRSLSQEPPVASPILDDRNQPSQDVQVSEPVFSQPEVPTTPITEPMNNDPDIEEELASLATSGLEQSLETKATEEQPSEPTADSKSKKDKKESDNQLVTDQPVPTENAGTEAAFDVQSPAVIEQATSETLPETTDDQAVGDHEQEADSRQDIEPSSVAPSTPIGTEQSIDLPKSTDSSSAQLPLDDKASTGNIEATPTKKSKKDKKKKKKQESSQDDVTPLPEPEQSAEIPATIQTSEATGLSESILPEESKDGDITSPISPKKTKKDKKKKKLASVQDEKASPEPPAEPLAEPVAEIAVEPTVEHVLEPAQTSPDYNDAGLSTEPDNSQAIAPFEPQDTLQVEEATNVDATLNSPNKEGKLDDSRETPVDLSEKEVIPDPQIEPLADPAKSDQNDDSLPTELDNSPADELPEAVDELLKTEEQSKFEQPFIAEELPKVEEPSKAAEELPKAEESSKADSIEDTSASTPTKKSKKDKKKKKKAAGREEEALLDDNKTLADSVSGATELSEPITTVSAEAGEGKATESHNVSGDTATAQDKTILQDDNTPKTEDVTLDETVTRDEDATRSEVAPQDDGAPQEGDSKEEGALQSKPVSDGQPSDESTPARSEENQKEKSASSWEDELLQEFAEKSAEAPVDLVEPTENISIQEPAGVEGVTDTASVKKSKKEKKKKKQSSPLAEEVPEEVPEEKPSEDPIPTAVVDAAQNNEDQVQAPTTKLDDDDPVVPTTPTKKAKKDKKKKKAITQDDELVEEQLTHDSALAATADVTSSAANESSESQPAVLEPPASEPPISEPAASEPSNEDSLIQPISKKKSKKDKKKKKQVASLEDDVSHEALLEGDAPKADPPQEQLAQVDLPQEEISRKELSAEAPPEEGNPQEELPKEELPREELPEEELPKELSRDELAPEGVSEITQDIIGLDELGQVTLPQVEAEATSEPAIVIEPEKTPNDETIQVDIPPNDDSPISTPTKKSKKDKKKKKQASASEDVPAPQEEPNQPMESQPPSTVEIASEVGLSPGGETSETVAPDDAKLEDILDSAPTKKSKKDKKKKKQALLEADPAQEPLEAPVDPIVPSVPDSGEQAEAGAALPDVSRETEAISEPSSTKSKKDGEEDKPTSWEDEVPSQLQQSLEPDLSRDASAEPSQSEGVLELTPSKKAKKNKKKKRASEVEPQPESETGANPDSAIGLTEPAEIHSSSPQAEQLPIHVIEDQGSDSRETKPVGQNEVAKPADNLGASAQSTEPHSTEETTLPAKLDDTGEPNVESKISETSTNIVPEDVAQELSSQDQQAAPRAAEDEPLHEVKLETGREIGTDNLTPLQEPETTQPTTTQPETEQPETGQLETGQPEEAAPKVDDGTNTATSKKSKKDKKKKKRASQVSWELGPEAEIEDLPEKQQSEQAFDKPITSEPTEMGNSDKVVGDPFCEFASGEKSEDKEQRQSQMEGESEPDSAKTVEELKPITPTEQEQQFNLLLDHQSLAEDTETSLKDSTNLDDTFLETTSSKKSKKKKNKASQLNWDAEPATTVTSESATGPILVEQNQEDKQAQSVHALPIETIEITPGEEADQEKVLPEIVSTKQSKKDKHRAEKQSTEETPEPETIRQRSENDATINNSTSQTEPTATANLMPVEDGSPIPENPSIPYENAIAEELSHNLPAEKAKSLVDQAQCTRELSQGQSAIRDADVSGTVVNIEPSHADPSDSGNYTALSGKLEGASNEVSLEQAGVQQVEVTTEIQKDATTDASQDPPQELPEFSTKKSKKDGKAQVLAVSDTDSNKKSDTITQSWDWSNIDNVTQPEISVPKELSNSELPATFAPSEATQRTSQLKQKEQPSNDNVDSSKLELGKPETHTHLEPEPELEFPVARNKSKKDKKKNKKAVGQSESETASAPDTPQTQSFEGVSDSQNAAPPDRTIREVEAIEPQNKEGTVSGKKSKKDKKRAKASLEETPHGASQMPAALEQPTSDEIPEVQNQNAEARSPPAADQPVLPQEQTSVTHDVLSEKPAIVPDIAGEGQLPVSDSRPRTPPTSRQVPTTVDMSPAQLSSHIEHDRPFDQSTQPDKKLRTHLGEDDTMVPEPLSAMTTELSAPVPLESDSRVSDAMAIDIPIVSRIRSNLEPDGIPRSQPLCRR